MRVAHLRILVIDDNEADAFLVERLLKRVKAFSAEVLKADSHEAGLRFLATAEADCIFLDYLLGPRCGLETLRAIRDRGDDTAVVFVTGFGSEMVAVEALQCGAQDYLVKSVLSAEVLQRAILNAVEKVALSRQVGEKQRELEDFVSVVAHDLQQPLCAVKGNIELIRDFYHPCLDSQGMEFVEAAVRTSTRMAEMIEALLGYSRAGRERSPINNLDLNEIAACVKSDLAGLILDNGARVEISPLPPVAGDPVTLAQLLQNLIANAIKFRREESPVVTVTGEKQGGSVILQVQDNSMGIPKTSLEEVFAPFRRLPQAKGRSGSGIGLATCKKIVEQHHGRIWVESELGQGSTFFISLPAPTTGRANDDAWRVLLVDEDAAAMQPVVDSLERRGIEVVRVGRAAEAARLVDEERFEGLLVDLSLQGGKGIELIPRLRECSPQTTILAVTAGDGRNGPGPLLAEARRQGADHVLPKPLDGGQVATALRRMIAEAQQAKTVA